MTKDNLGSEQWQSDQARIQALETKMRRSLAMIEDYATVEGAFDSAWVLVQVLRILLGDQYDEWVASHNVGEAIDRALRRS